MQRPSLFLFSVLSSVVLFAAACEPASERESATLTVPGGSSNSSTAAASGSTGGSSSGTASGSASGATATDAGETPASPDQMDYGMLKWSYGGVSGRGYAASGVSISGLRVSGRNLSFRYNTNLSAWGYSTDAVGGYACLFVQKEDGSWVGGKFDWISSSRSSRGLENVFGGYGGWNLKGVPNPCPAAFVILDANKKRRSNVIVGTWSR